MVPTVTLNNRLWFTATTQGKWPVRKKQSLQWTTRTNLSRNRWTSVVVVNFKCWNLTEKCAPHVVWATSDQLHLVSVGQESLSGFLSLQWNVKARCSFTHQCILWSFGSFAIMTPLLTYGQVIPFSLFLFIRLKQQWKSWYFDACIWSSTIFLVLSRFFFFRAKNLYPFYIWWCKMNIFLLKSLISMCIRGLNKGRNLHVKLLLCRCCPFHNAQDYLKTLVLSQVRKSCLSESGHYSPSAIQSSQLAPLSWFIFYKIIQSYYVHMDYFLQDACFSTLNDTFDGIVTKIE